MKQCPYRIVVLVPKLTLKFSGGETFLRACKKVHRYEPVSQRKLTAVHHGVCLETLPVATMLALVAFLVLLPIILCTSAVRATTPCFSQYSFNLLLQLASSGKTFIKSISLISLLFIGAK